MEARQLIGRISKVSQDGDDQGELIFKELASASGSVLSAYLSFMSSSNERHRDLALYFVLMAQSSILISGGNCTHLPHLKICCNAWVHTPFSYAWYSLPVTSESTMSVVVLGHLRMPSAVPSDGWKLKK